MPSPRGCLHQQIANLVAWLGVHNLCPNLYVVGADRPRGDLQLLERDGSLWAILVDLPEGEKERPPLRLLLVYLGVAAPGILSTIWQVPAPAGGSNFRSV